MIARALIVVAVIAAARIAAAQPVELRANRGIDGVVAAGGIEVVDVEVVSRADAEAAVQVAIDGVARALDLPARGRATITVGRRVPASVGSLPPLEVRVGEVSLEVPAARVVRRPVVVIADDAAPALAAVAAWRTDELGPPILITPEATPSRWEALVGVGAVVLDRPVAALEGDAGRTVQRFLDAGGQVCRLDGAQVICARAAPVATPQTPVVASSAPVPRRLGAVAATMMVALGLGALVRRRATRVAVLAVAVVAAMVAVAARPRLAMRAHGVRIAAGDEDWVAAELGVAETAPLPRLDGDLWIEPSGDELGLGRLDERGFLGQIPAPGSWRVRGFVPAGGAGWTGELAPVARDRVTP